ncbi:MAG: hypothetical protein HIU84_12765 [Acidobacteria bacterium]|nr:hypothetical protein [Acidobacteriota bacterium]
MRARATRVTSEICQYFEFLRCEVHPHAIKKRFVVHEIDVERAAVDGDVGCYFGFTTSTADRDSNSRFQLTHAEWFGHIVVNADRKQPH